MTRSTALASSWSFFRTSRSVIRFSKRNTVSMAVWMLARIRALRSRFRMVSRNLAPGPCKIDLSTRERDEVGLGYAAKIGERFSHSQILSQLPAHGLIF